MAGLRLSVTTSATSIGVLSPGADGQAESAQLPRQAFPERSVESKESKVDRLAHQGHTWSMTELFRCRVDGALLADAKRVAEDIGTDCGVLVNIMFKQLVKRRTVPFPLMSDIAEDEILSPAGRRAAMLDEMYEGKPSAR